MTTEFKSNDLIISYTVRYDGDLSKDYSRLQDALDNKFRVVDILTTPGHTSEKSSGYTCITVFLRHEISDGFNNDYCGHVKPKP
jgi:hypothetical protein